MKKFGYLMLGFFLFACQSKEMKKAKEYLDASMYNEAASLLEIEIQDNPKNAEASYLLGLCSYNLGNNDKTEQYFKRAILLETDYKKKIGSFFYDKAIDLVKNKKLESVERIYNEALKYDPLGKEEFSDKLYNYAISEIEVSTESPQIVIIFNYIKNITPRYNQKIADITFNKAKVFIEKGFYKDGFIYGEYSIKSDPIHIKDLSILYLSYAQSLSDSPENCLNAFFYFDRSIELDNLNKMKIAEIYYNISNNYIKSKNYSIVLLYAKRAKEINESYNKWYADLYTKYSAFISVNYPFTTEIWAGAKWCFNNGPYSWLPSQNSSEATFAIDDYCWGQIHTKDYFHKNQKISFELLPQLNSGGVNGDMAFFGFGSDWVIYGGLFEGIVFMNGREIYFWDTQKGGKQKLIGNFQRNNWINISIEITENNELKVHVGNIYDEYKISNVPSSYKFITAEGNSIDGFKIRNISSIGN